MDNVVDEVEQLQRLLNVARELDFFEAMDFLRREIQVRKGAKPQYHGGNAIDLVSIASSAVGAKWGMGALHLGIAVLEAIPDGWAKIGGQWVFLQDNIAIIPGGE